MRERPCHEAGFSPDFASLHPGYDTQFLFTIKKYSSSENNA